MGRRTTSVPLGGGPVRESRPALTRGTRDSLARSLSTAEAQRQVPVRIPQRPPVVGPGTVGVVNPPIVVPGGPLVVPGMPPTVSLIEAGYREAVNAAAGTTVLQTFIAAAAYQWSNELARPNGRAPTGAMWAQLVSRAEQNGIRLPADVPRTADALAAMSLRQQWRVLELIRRGGVEAVSHAGAPPARTAGVSGLRAIPARA